MGMIFEIDTLSFNIIDVLELEQENVNTYNSGRNFSALSFRINSDAVLTTATESYPLGDAFVAFVPAHLNYRRTAKKDKLIVIHFDIINYHAKTIEAFKALEAETLTKLFREILRVWNEKDIGYKYRCAALLYDVLGECYRQNFKATDETSKIQKSVEYMHSHYMNADISIGSIAKKSYMSEVYFRKLFRAEFGISPQKYIMRLRILRAVKLLSTGYYPLKEVAYLSGYTDYKYFSTEFKKQMGVSPSEYDCHTQKAY